MKDSSLLRSSSRSLACSSIGCVPWNIGIAPLGAGGDMGRTSPLVFLLVL